MTINTYNSNFALNDDLIFKLKSAETESINKNLDKQMNMLNNNKKIQNGFDALFNNLDKLISEKVSDFSASFTGNNMSISSNDNIREGSYMFDVKSLYKEDVYESKSFGNIHELYGEENITVGSATFSTSGMNVSEVIDKLNSLGVDASFQKTSSNENKIIVKGTIESDMVQKQEASKLEINIDGVDYSFDSNDFEFNGINISVYDTGKSSLNIKNDGEGTKEKLNSIIDKYNELIGYINDTMINNDEYRDSSVYRNIATELKNSFFENGLFELGFSLDKNGKITGADISTEKSNEFISNLESKLTNLKENLNIHNDFTDKRKSEIETTMSRNLENIDKRYADMKNQFISYNQLISRMELNFASLRQMIELSYQK